MRYIILTALCTLCISANADWTSNTNWKLVNQTPDGETSLYYAPSSIKKTGSNLELWTVLNSKTPQFESGMRSQFHSMQIRYILDCKLSKAKNIYMTLNSELFGAGNVLLTLNAEEKGIAHWDYPPPGSLIATLFHLCR